MALISGKIENMSRNVRKPIKDILPSAKGLSQTQNSPGYLLGLQKQHMFSAALLSRIAENMGIDTSQQTWPVRMDTRRQYRCQTKVRNPFF